MPCGYITIISVIYSQLARAKSENLDNIYSSFKQNIKSCNAKRRRQRWRTVKNNDRSNKQKKATLHVQHTFLCISLPLFCPGGGGGWGWGTLLYELYQVRYVPPHRDGFCAVLV